MRNRQKSKRYSTTSSIQRAPRPYGIGCCGPACHCEPIQWQIMWSRGHGLQSRLDDCRLRCSESCPGGVDRCSDCGPEHALIAGLTHFDCSPLHLIPGSSCLSPTEAAHATPAWWVIPSGSEATRSVLLGSGK